MNELDLIERITKTNRVRRIGKSIYTDEIKWTKSNVIKRAIKNALLRKLIKAKNIMWKPKKITLQIELKNKWIK